MEKLKDIAIITSDEQFDVINPPDLLIEDIQGEGAEGFLGVTGSLKKINVVNRGFDYEGTPTVKVVGGNGRGASVLVNMKQTDNVSEF